MMRTALSLFTIVLLGSCLITSPEVKISGSTNVKAGEDIILEATVENANEFYWILPDSSRVDESSVVFPTDSFSSRQSLNFEFYANTKSGKNNVFRSTQVNVQPLTGTVVFSTNGTINESLSADFIRTGDNEVTQMFFTTINARGATCANNRNTRQMNVGSYNVQIRGNFFSIDTNVTLVADGCIEIPF